MPKPTNEVRAERARRALRAWANGDEPSCEDITTDLIDMIADALHLAEQCGLGQSQAYNILQMADDHFTEERDKED